jgi:hypothetical protein
MEANSYSALINTQAQTKEDDRRGSIEIQYSNDVELTPDNVMAIVMPRPFWDDPDIAQFVCGTLGAEALSYDTFHAQPIEDVRSIMQAVLAFLTDKGLV